MPCKSKVAVLAAVAVLLPTPAFAYIDPAVGSMMLQGLLGAIAVAGTAWYTLRQRVVAFFSNTKFSPSARAADKK